MSDFGIIKTYIQLNEQVTLQNQDPVKEKAGLKPSLIDLEAYGKCYGDKGQGRELSMIIRDAKPLVRAERLNERDPFLTRICESLISIRKIERIDRRICPA